MPICYPGNGQKDEITEAGERSRSKLELSSRSSLPPSQRNSAEGGSSPSLTPPKDTSSLSPHSPSGLLRSVKKRESKGKGKELKGTVPHPEISLLTTAFSSHSTFTKQNVATITTVTILMSLTGSLLAAVDIIMFF